VNGTRDWDADTYHRVSTPQVRWAETVLDRLELRGDETVLDAGCGSGRVTAMLVGRLPEGRVVAVDGSASMAEAARAALPADRADTMVCDLAELELDAPVDAVFSNAVFHWIPDHDRLFARLHAALKPGGQLVAQCGGWRTESRVEPDDAAGFASTVCLGSHLERLPEALRDGYAADVLQAAGEPLVLDYIRLNIVARA
jgi:trans-aconitate 2-methyltransferase